MPLRFTDTEKWKDNWWQSLSNDYKIIWQYLLDNCDHAGTFKKEFRLMNFECGTNITEQQFDKVFGSRIQRSEKYNRWVIVNFCRLQYPSGIESNKPVIVSVRNVLNKYGFLTIIMQSFNNDSLIIKDKDKDKDKEMDKEMDEEIGGVEERGLAIVNKRETRPASLESALTLFTELGRPDQAQEFMDYYDSNGWKVGRNPMKDWKATARRWVRNAKPIAGEDRKLLKGITVQQHNEGLERFKAIMESKNNGSSQPS